MIPDPAAKKPEDWDAEIDGEWEGKFNSRLTVYLPFDRIDS